MFHSGEYEHVLNNNIIAVKYEINAQTTSRLAEVQGSASFVDPFLFLCLTFVFIILSGVFLTCWERVDLWALLCVMFPCDFVTFPYCVFV